MGLPTIVPIWQYHMAQANGDGWRFMFSQNPNLASGWTRDQIVWYAFATADGGGIPIYQYHAVQKNGDGWRYTYSSNPNLGAGWTRDDGVAWYAFGIAIPNSVPIYQFHAVQADGDGWRFTFSPNRNLGAGWTFDSTAFYALPPSTGTSPDFGLRIASPGNVTIPSNGAYNFAGGDFSVTALFQTTSPGTVVSRKSTEGGSSAYAGWLVVIKPGGAIKFATDNGFGFYEVNSVGTSALDGRWHHVAAIRRNGQLEIWLDGAHIAASPRGSLPTPLDVSSGLRVVIGGTDQRQEPYNQFVGTIEDVTIWNRPIATDQILASMFNLLTGHEAGLVGLWAMNDSLADSSPTANGGSANGSVSFIPVFHATWVQGAANAFSFVSIINQGSGSGAQGAAAPTSRTQTLLVASGAPFLLACISDPNRIVFPAGAQLSIQDPQGRSFTQGQDTQDVYVGMSGTSVWHLCMRNPMPGNWTAQITAPASVAFRFWFQTLPSANLVGTITSALAPVYGLKQSAPAARGLMAMAEGDPGTGAVAILGGIGLGVVAVMACAIPGGQGIGFWAGAGAALLLSAGAAQLWGDSAKEAKLSPDQAASQAAGTAGFTSSGQRIQPSMAEVYKRVRDKIGDPATTDPASFASRAVMQVDANYSLHLDIGGEGRFTAHGITSRFENALNANAQVNNSQYQDRPIPMLVHVRDWTVKYPFVDGTFNYITMQGAPLTKNNLTEIARLLVRGGKVGLWIAPDQVAEPGRAIRSPRRKPICKTRMRWRSC